MKFKCKNFSSIT